MLNTNLIERSSILAKDNVTYLNVTRYIQNNLYLTENKVNSCVNNLFHNVADIFNIYMNEKVNSTYEEDITPNTEQINNNVNSYSENDYQNVYDTYNNLAIENNIDYTYWNLNNHYDELNNLNNIFSETYNEAFNKTQVSFQIVNELPTDIVNANKSVIYLIENSNPQYNMDYYDSYYIKNNSYEPWGSKGSLNKQIMNAINATFNIIQNDIDNMQIASNELNNQYNNYVNFDYDFNNLFNQFQHIDNDYVENKRNHYIVQQLVNNSERIVQIPDSLYGLSGKTGYKGDSYKNLNITEQENFVFINLDLISYENNTITNQSFNLNGISLNSNYAVIETINLEDNSFVVYYNDSSTTTYNAVVNEDIIETNRTLQEFINNTINNIPIQNTERYLKTLRGDNRISEIATEIKEEFIIETDVQNINVNVLTNLESIYPPNIEPNAIEFNIYNDKGAIRINTHVNNHWYEIDNIYSNYTLETYIKNENFVQFMSNGHTDHTKLNNFQDIFTYKFNNTNYTIDKIYDNTIISTVPIRNLENIPKLNNIYLQDNYSIYQEIHDGQPIFVVNTIDNVDIKQYIDKATYNFLNITTNNRNLVIDGEEYTRNGNYIFLDYAEYDNINKQLILIYSDSNRIVMNFNNNVYNYLNTLHINYAYNEYNNVLYKTIYNEIDDTNSIEIVQNFDAFKRIRKVEMIETNLESTDFNNINLTIISKSLDNTEILNYIIPIYNTEALQITNFTKIDHINQSSHIVNDQEYDEYYYNNNSGFNRISVNFKLGSVKEETKNFMFNFGYRIKYTNFWEANLMRENYTLVGAQFIGKTLENVVKVNSMYTESVNHLEISGIFVRPKSGNTTFNSSRIAVLRY